MIGNRIDAEDITQEVFLTVYKKINTLRKEEHFKSWIYTIAKNSTLNWIAKNPRLKKSVSADNDYRFLKDNDTPEQKVISQDLKKIVKTHLNNMPPDCKLAFVLRIFNELEYKEIAAITDWPLSKVKMNIHRARLFMRDKLKSFIEE